MQHEADFSRAGRDRQTRWQESLDLSQTGNTGAGRRPGDTSAIEANITLLEGGGEFHAIFEEANGSSYIVPLKPIPKKGRSARAYGVLKRAEWGATWSLADPNGSIDPRQIRSIRIGCNTKDAQVRYRIEGLRWLRY